MRPVSRTSMRSLAITLPAIFPTTVTCFAETSPWTSPFGPMVRWKFRSDTRPSTRPSRIVSSSPTTSPLMLIDLPMFAISIPPG